MLTRICTALSAGILLAAASVFPVLAAGELHLYNWTNYIDPKILDQFAEEFDVKVSLDTYESNEAMLAKLQAGATGYDIVFPSVHMQDIMSKLDLLQKVDFKSKPGFKNIDKSFFRAETDPDMEYCLPYGWGTTGIIYNKKFIPKLTSWKGFFTPPEAAKGKITMLNDMRETIGVALLYLGYSVNSTDEKELAEAMDFLIEQKRKNLGAFLTDGVRQKVANGDLAAGHFWTGAMRSVFQNPENLQYIIPEEGAVMYQENICALKSAKNKENIELFFEFFMRPEIAAQNAVRQKNGTMNIKARELLPAEMKHPAISPPPEVLSKLQLFRDLGEGIRKYDRVWTRVKAAN